MARRSSARIRNRNSSTPKRVSLSHDAPIRTPRTAPVKLSSLPESDEMPGAFPNSASPAPRPAEETHTTKVPLKFDDETPKKSTPIKPAAEEMHPGQHHQSTAKPLEEARWLGFSNMAPHTEPLKQTSKLATLQGTPTRNSTSLNSPKYNFSFQREQSLELSPEAKKLMSEKREEAARIREQMIANGDGAEDVAVALGRRIATPKGKKGRFSEVHMEEFKKMESIANHPSAWRANANKSSAADTPIRVQTESQRVQIAVPSPAKSLKRSPSKAELDEPQQPPRSLPRPSSKAAFGASEATNLPRSASKKNLHADDDSQQASPSKRVKRSAAEDVTTARPASSSSDKPRPMTPVAKKVHIVSPHVSTLASPTEASLARTASIKSAKTTKIPAPALTRTPSKVSFHPPPQETPKQSTPLLARSPSKSSIFARHTIQDAKGESKSTGSPLLQRSPLKASLPKTSEDPRVKDDIPAKGYPLLSRSPLKASVAKSSDAPEGVKEKAAPSTPLLSRSPAKIQVEAEKANESSTKIPGKSNLLGRFNLLRASPMKSILRSPQRLYSDDPAKVAAGTHLATPPKITHSKSKDSATGGPKTAPVQKHVDFTSSTKDRYERAQSELSSTPSKGPTPPPQQPGSASKAPASLYPNLPPVDTTPIVTPQKRRQTATPADFTFRAGEHTIIFSQSPNAPLSASNSKRANTIRHVSAEPQFPATTAKKRKFEFENETAADAEKGVEVSDKENADGDERPAKRIKPSAPSPSPQKAAVRRTTLGVKPKKTADGKEGAKKPSTISRARLNALAQPKRRA
jgi:hypothetical protein